MARARRAVPSRATAHDLLNDRGEPFAALQVSAIAHLELKSGERLLVVGSPPPAELPLPPAVVEHAADAPPTLAETLADPSLLHPHHLEARRFSFADDSFDAVALHDALPTSPHPARCLFEAARVLKDGGRLSVLDAFLPPDFRPPLWHSVSKGATEVVFRTATRTFAELLKVSGAPLEILVDQSAPAPSPLREILLRKCAATGSTRAAENLAG